MIRRLVRGPMSFDVADDICCTPAWSLDVRPGPCYTSAMWPLRTSTTAWQASLTYDYVTPCNALRTSGIGRCQAKRAEPSVAPAVQGWGAQLQGCWLYLLLSPVLGRWGRDLFRAGALPA